MFQGKNSIVWLFVLGVAMSVMARAEVETYSATEDAGGIPEAMPMEDTYSVDPVTSRVKRDEAQPVVESRATAKRLRERPASKKRSRAAERAEISRETLREGSLSYSVPKDSSINERLNLRKQAQGELRDSVSVSKSAPSPAAMAEEEDDFMPSPPSSPSSTYAAPKSSLSPAASPAAFDPVPSDQIDSVASRLQLVEQILRKFGRAYDYRTVTASDLMRIYRDLASTTSASVSYD